MSEDTNQPKSVSWFLRLKRGLARSSDKLSNGITALLLHKKIDQNTLDHLQDLLISADLGVGTAEQLTKNIAHHKFENEITDHEVRQILAFNMARMLEPFAKPLNIISAARPHVTLVCGVNGSGKTTTIGKLAHQWKRDGKTVVLAAGDTFRAAAVEQLEIWGTRTGAPVIAKPQGSDPAALAFDSLIQAKQLNADILLIDTAGRLQNKSQLMDELTKIVRVLKKQNPEAPHDCVLVLDGTVGQNAHNQVKVFRECVDVSGLVVTKLDGSARGGVVIALTQEFGLPLHAIGVGEEIDDLQPFEAVPFAQNLMGLN